MASVSRGGTLAVPFLPVDTSGKGWAAKSSWNNIALSQIKGAVARISVSGPDA